MKWSNGAKVKMFTGLVPSGDSWGEEVSSF